MQGVDTGGKMNATAANIKCYDEAKGEQGATLVWTMQDPASQQISVTSAERGK
jgi:hypothetical protein